METLPSAPRDYTKETALAQRVARIFGYNGLVIEVREGAGWATMRNESGITLFVDPTMLQPQTLKDAMGNELPSGTQAPNQYSVYGIAHELGHVDDFMQPENSLKNAKEIKPSEHFFWNVLDDGVINRRLRNIPLLNSLTEEVYKDMLFPVDDYSNMPKHVQLMYGWLLRNVTPQREVTFSEEVTKALDYLSDIDVAGKHYDLYRTLAHPDTDFAKRREVASEYILPIYEAFLEEDRQNPQPDPEQNQSQKSQASGESNGSDSGKGEPQEQQGDKSSDQSSQPYGGGGSSGGQATNWEEIYEAYGEASHCGHHEHNHEEASKSNDGGDKKDPHDAIKKAADALREIKEKKAEKEKKSIESQSYGSNHAGSIAAELNLSPEDAQQYRQVVEQYRTQIQEVAKVLQQLTVPSVQYTSPRYQRRADTNGLKLSPRDLFRAVVAHHSNTDPAVWKPVETISKKEGLSFNGLDIHLVVDSSGSMKGAKADGAAACSILLMEGLAAARRIVQRYSPRAPKPDVRLQVILFGSSTKVVAPLGHETEAKDKGITFTTVRDAKSNSTLVADALKLTVESSKANPERTQLVYLITDGDFSDKTNAVKALQNAGSNYFLYQYILLSPGTAAITTKSSYISNPTEMPSNVNKELRVLTARFLAK